MSITDKLDALRRHWEAVYRFIVIACGFGLLVLMAANVFVRVFPVVSLHWFDEIVELLFAWMIFLGSAVLYSRKDHFMIDWLAKKTEGTAWQSIYRILIEILCLVFVLVFLTQGARLTILARDWTAVFNIPKRVLYAALPLSGVFMVAVSIMDVWKAAASLKIGAVNDDEGKSAE